MRKSKDWLARNQDNVYECYILPISGVLLFLAEHFYLSVMYTSYLTEGYYQYQRNESDAKIINLCDIIHVTLLIKIITSVLKVLAYIIYMHTIRLTAILAIMPVSTFITAVILCLFNID
jgi:hypothetical protein